jgi:hypothetical protein
VRAEPREGRDHHGRRDGLPPDEPAAALLADALRDIDDAVASIAGDATAATAAADIP